MELNDFCPYCDHFMEEGIDPMIDFPCLHRAHSTCFLRLLSNNLNFSLDQQFRNCQFCAVSLFETEVDDEPEEEFQQEIQEEEQAQIEGPEQEEVHSQTSDSSLTYYERLRKRFHDNEQMQRDVKGYIKAKRACGPKRIALKKFVSSKKQEIKHSVDSLRDQLDTLLSAQKKMILQGQPYKDYKGAHFRVTILRARIANRYGIDMDGLRRALRNEKGYRQWTRDFRWRDQPNYIVRRGFYRRCIRI